jgi:hypothetical protein
VRTDSDVREFGEMIVSSLNIEGVHGIACGKGAVVLRHLKNVRPKLPNEVIEMVTEKIKRYHESY